MLALFSPCNAAICTIFKATPSSNKTVALLYSCPHCLSMNQLSAPDVICHKHCEAAQCLSLRVHHIPGLLQGVCILLCGIVRAVPKVRPQAGYLPALLCCTRCIRNKISFTSRSSTTISTTTCQTLCCVYWYKSTPASLPCCRKRAGSIPEHDTLTPDRLVSCLNEGAAVSLECAAGGAWHDQKTALSHHLLKHTETIPHQA